MYQKNLNKILIKNNFSDIHPNMTNIQKIYINSIIVKKKHLKTNKENFNIESKYVKENSTIKKNHHKNENINFEIKLLITQKKNTTTSEQLTQIIIRFTTFNKSSNFSQQLDPDRSINTISHHVQNTIN